MKAAILRDEVVLRTFGSIVGMRYIRLGATWRDVRVDD
jgi:hypothetical protein